MIIKGWSLVSSRPARSTLEAGVRFVATSSLTRTEERKRRSALFDEEKKRQRAGVGRIEKIHVKYSSWNENITLLMNKNISTPYDCARHVSEGMADLSALATANGSVWDMHRPLEEDCDLWLSTMRTPGDKNVNNAFWRTCSLMLGSVIESAFRDDIIVYPHSFTGPNLKSGSFIYDAQLGVENWQPTQAEMRSVSALFVKLVSANLPVERLTISTNLALDIFRGNPHKSKQIPDIGSNNDNKIVVYRIGDYLDISKGPVVGNTGLVGRCTVTAVHKIHNEESDERLYRFQGVAIPTGILLNHFTYGILEERAKKLNQSAWMPQRANDEHEENLAIAANN